VLNRELEKYQKKQVLLLRKKNIIIDMHNGGPIIYTPFLLKVVKKLISEGYAFSEIINQVNKISHNLLIHNLDYKREYKKRWDISGITVACRTVGIFGQSPFSYKKTIEDIGLICSQIDHTEWLVKITKYKDILKAKKFHKHGFILRLENITPLGRNFEKIELFYNLGVRIIQLTYNDKNNVGCGCMSRKDTGLTEYGKRIIKYLNKKRILIDVSHCGPRTTMEIIQYSQIPVIATHTFCKALYNHPRGKSDEEIKYLAKKGGIIGISINPSFFTRYSHFSISNFLDHIDHVVRIVGINHIGIGTDWDTTLPPLLKNFLTKFNIYSRWYDWRKETEGYRDQRDWINIIKGLISRGYKEDEIKAIIGGNFLKIFKKVVG